MPDLSVKKTKSHRILHDGGGPWLNTSLAVYSIMFFIA